MQNPKIESETDNLRRREKDIEFANRTEGKPEGVQRYAERLDWLIAKGILSQNL